MKKLNLSLDKNKKYVVACSFGPDSMALLDAALKENLDVVVAHVNYRKRDASEMEQKSLEKFCNVHQIKLCILDLINQVPSGNFQDWARKKRYEFFKTVVEKEKAFAVLVAHQQDDVIETYLMQKNRGNIVKNYGISRENELFGMKIIRPLLDYTKQELKDYDVENNVPFSIDESNLTDHYTRNKIRHSIVEQMSKKERAAILQEISNISIEKFSVFNKLTKEEFLNLSYESLIKNLDYFMQKVSEHSDVSEKFVAEIKQAFRTKTNLRYKITPSVWLELDYGEVFIVNGAKIRDYKFTFERKGNNNFIDIDFSMGAEDRGIVNLPQEILIKNCDKNDSLIIKDYNSKVNRLFIDWKIPLFLREVWPGIYDEKERLIYVPRYRKSFKDEHKSIFKIDTEYFLRF